MLKKQVELPSIVGLGLKYTIQTPEAN